VPLHLQHRPPGLSSRLRPAAGPRHPWTAPNGHVVDLPLVLDLIELSEDHELRWYVEATVDHIDGEPRLTQVVVSSDEGLHPVALQRSFRWSTPLDVVRRAVPALLAAGIDPFTYAFPADGYPASAEIGRGTQRALTDEFLEDIAHRYLELGRGYARTIAYERGVSSRTAVSWIEKARQRGILTPVPAGSHGGHIIPPNQRRPR
jgi:hypothetical protein